MNRDYEIRIGHNIRVLRERAGMTQDALAAQFQLMGCDITRSAVAKIEAGQRHIYPDELALFRSILNTSYEDILEKGECRDFFQREN